jgi:hypothetical protein
MQPKALFLLTQGANIDPRLHHDLGCSFKLPFKFITVRLPCFTRITQLATFGASCDLYRDLNLCCLSGSSRGTLKLQIASAWY